MAEMIPSPNYTPGRGGKTVDLVVVHWMAGTLAATDATFESSSSGTSAHYGIEDATVHQYVGEENTAYHAGNFAINQRSIGIEHSAAPGRDASSSTIETSAALIANICLRYGIPCDRKHVIKHSEVIATQCPGTIPIDELVTRANQLIKGGSMDTISEELDNTMSWLAANDFPGPMYNKQMWQGKELNATNVGYWVNFWLDVSRKIGVIKRMTDAEARVAELEKQVADLQAQVAKPVVVPQAAIDRASVLKYVNEKLG